MEVDFGEEIGTKKAFSGIMKFFAPKDLIGKQFPFVVNLEPKTIGPEKELSEAMMIMAVPSEDEETPTVLFKLQKKVPNGTKVR
jgi:tRNA-binding EMAP/Myf-like protein